MIAVLQRRLVLPLCPRYQAVFYQFSQHKKEQWSQSAQEAVFASFIMNFILHSQPPGRYDDLSLRQKIINYHFQQKQIKISGQVRNRVLQMFTTGITLNKNIFHQSRTVLASQPKIHPYPKLYQSIQAKPQILSGQKTLPNQQKRKLKNQQLKKDMQKAKKREQNLLFLPGKFIFCPNYIVTKQIFNFFRRVHLGLNSCKSMIIGNSGTAKSISILLYIHLSNYIHNFLYQAEKDPQLKGEFRRLKYSNLIMLNVPKIFYYTVYMERPYLNYSEFLLQQLPQLSSREKQYLQNISKPHQFKDYLNKLYAQSPQKVLVVDQIDMVATGVRNWNTNIDQFIKRKQRILQSKSQTSNKQLDNMQAAIFQQKYFQTNLQQVLRNIRQLGYHVNKVVLSSPVDIEKSLLQEKSYRQQKRGLGFSSSHYEIQKIRLPIQKQLKSSISAKVDFWHYFWFQITRRTFSNPVLQKKLNQLKPKIIEKLFRSKQYLFQIKSYYHFFYVRTYADNYNLKLDESIPQEEIIQKIYRFARSFQLDCMKEYKYHLQYFMKNNRFVKNHFDFMIYLYTQAVKQQKKGNNTLEIKQKDFECYKYFVNYSEYERQEKMLLLSRQFLSLNIVGQDIHFNISPKQFIQISTTLLFPVLQKQYPLEVFLNKKNDSMIGRAFQLYLINCLEYACLSFNFAQFKTVQLAKQCQKQQQVNKTFSIDSIKKIQAFSKNISDSQANNVIKEENLITYFSRFFQSLSSYCKQSPGKYIIGVPQVCQKTDSNSASIDFVIGILQYGQFKLFTFDTSICTQKTKVNLYQKENNTKKMLVSCLTEENSKFIVQHTILSPIIPSSIRKQIFKPLKQNELTITYANWKDLEIRYSKDKESQKLFNEVKKLLVEENSDNVDTLEPAEPSKLEETPEN